MLSATNDRLQSRIAEINRQDAILREYIREMKEILLDKSVAIEARRPSSEARGVARALTLTALSQLSGPDSSRRSLIFQFLYDADFSILGRMGRQGRPAVLRNYNLSRTTMILAKLRGADLRSANLSEADLRGADLREAALMEANLVGADLRRTNFRGADLSGADLRGADLKGAYMEGIKSTQATSWPSKEVRESALHLPEQVK